MGDEPAHSRRTDDEDFPREANPIRKESKSGIEKALLVTEGRVKDKLVEEEENGLYDSTDRPVQPSQEFCDNVPPPPKKTRNVARGPILKTPSTPNQISSANRAHSPVMYIPKKHAPYTVCCTGPSSSSSINVVRDFTFRHVLLPILRRSFTSNASHLTSSPPPFINSYL